MVNTSTANREILANKIEKSHNERHCASPYSGTLVSCGEYYTNIGNCDINLDLNIWIILPEYQSCPIRRSKLLIAVNSSLTYIFSKQLCRTVLPSY